MIGKKIANKITKFSKHSQQNNLDTVPNKNGKEIPKERYMSPKEKQKLIDDLGLI